MGWDAVQTPPATKKQRMALYHLGFSKSKVKSMDTIQADKAIKLGLKLWTELHDTVPEQPKD